MTLNLNQRTSEWLFPALEECFAESSQYKHSVENGGRWIDFGVTPKAKRAGINAGLLLARACMSNLCDIHVETAVAGDLEWPHVSVHSDYPLQSCLLSQYAGWQLSTDDFFGMGSGPMRAAARVEDLFTEFSHQETADKIVGVIESSQSPSEAVFQKIADQCGVVPADVVLLVAPTASLAGSVQIAARCLETALHKLHELKFDINSIVSGFGTAPLSPVAKNDLQGIGRTNDSILYGGRVHLYVTGDDAAIEKIGPAVPASAADVYGQPFLQIFEDAGRDFYKIDPHLFSPAQVTFQNVDSGSVFQYGRLDATILKTSFGI